MSALCEMVMTDEWHCIAFAAELSDTVEHYTKLGLPMEHLHLRELAERIAGCISGPYNIFGEFDNDSESQSSDYDDYYLEGIDEDESEDY